MWGVSAIGTSGRNSWGRMEAREVRALRTPMHSSQEHGSLQLAHVDRQGA